MYILFFLVLIFINYRLFMWVASDPKGFLKFNYKIKKFKNLWLSTGMYTFFYKYKKVSSNKLLLESHSGKAFNGNPYYIMKNSIISGYRVKVFVVGDKNELLKNKFIFENKKRIHFVKYKSLYYYYLLATSKYLINDVTFPPCFIKRKEQVYINTWHGTPLKAMGRHMSGNPLLLSNTQRNFCQCDYVISPNKLVDDMYISDYMINPDITKVIRMGYPRNSVFFESIDVKEKMGLVGKEIICLMLTWRDVKDSIELDVEIESQKRLISRISKGLSSNQMLYIKLHPLAQGELDISNFQNVFLFPSEYEIYEFLSISDCLISDYSSVIFDFALTKKKIILFCPDYKEYQSARGFKLDYFKDIPFVKVDTVEGLLSELNDFSIGKEAYDNFIERYCSFDSKSSPQEILELLICDEHLINEVKFVDSEKKKKNILIYSGQFLKNGITTSLLNLLSNLPEDEFDVTLQFNQRLVLEDDFNAIYGLPSHIKYYPMFGRMNMTPFENVILSLKLKNFHFFSKAMKDLGVRIYKREQKRLFSDMKFDHVIHFTGYDRKACYLYSSFDCKKTIFVHNDMKKEHQEKENYNNNAIKFAWKCFDNIAVVRESLIESCLDIVPDIQHKIKVVHNTIDINNIKEMSNLPLSDIGLDSVTYSKVLSDKVKFITIGRFSKEKGHVRLIEAFERVRQYNENVELFILGGYGPLYEETLKRKDASIYSDDINIISSLSNPYPLLKHMNAFILPSYYEGLPMVFFEAITLNVPVISTDIDGPSQFLSQGYGTLVDNSENGLYEGMTMFLNGKIKPTEKKLDTFNDQALKEFMSLL